MATLNICIVTGALCEVDVRAYPLKDDCVVLCVVYCEMWCVVCGAYLCGDVPLLRHSVLEPNEEIKKIGKNKVRLALDIVKRNMAAPV